MPKNTARIIPADPVTRASELLSDGNQKIHEGIAALAEARWRPTTRMARTRARWRELHEACKAVYALSLKAIPD